MANSSAGTVLRARLLIPTAGECVSDGAVVLGDGAVRAAGRWADLRPHVTGRIEDLGEVLVLPGLVNAHCHLDYTGMAGLIPPARSFTDWIKCMVTTKAEWSYTDFADSWLAGARMLLRHGTTTVADIEAVPELLPEVWSATPLRVHSFLEMTGVRSRRPASEVLGEAVAMADRLPSGRCCARLSPHAPYSTSPELLRLSARLCEQRGWRLTTHVAESDEEFAMFTNAQGPLYDWLRWNGREMSDCGRGSPVEHLARAGVLSDRFIGVHLNSLAGDDAALLGRAGAHAVHCPRSHEYFLHRRFPLEALREARVNVALGTDSAVTMRCYRGQPVELDLFAEMRTLAEQRPGVSPDAILGMATVSGARALGLDGRVGALVPGAWADLIAMDYHGTAEAAAEAAVHFRGSVSASMIGGGWAIAPSRGAVEARA